MFNKFIPMIAGIVTEIEATNNILSDIYKRRQLRKRVTLVTSSSPTHRLNGDEQELYVDSYKKLRKETISFK